MLALQTIQQWRVFVSRPREWKYGFQSSSRQLVRFQSETKTDEARSLVKAINQLKTKDAVISVKGIEIQALQAKCLAFPYSIYIIRPVRKNPGAQGTIGQMQNNTRKISVPNSRNIKNVSSLYSLSKVTSDKGYNPEPSLIFPLIYTKIFLVLFYFISCMC